MNGCKLRSAVRRCAAFLLAICMAVSHVAAKDDGPTVDSSPPPNLLDARDLFMTGSYDKAIAAYRALSDIPEHKLEAQLGLARCRLQIGQYDEALSGLEAAAGDTSASWHVLVATTQARKGRYDKTISHARDAIRLDERHAGARLLLANTLEDLGQRDSAIKAYAWFSEQLVGQETLPRDAEWITSTALGFLRYSVLTRQNVVARTKHVLNEMLQVAYERLDRTYWPARIAAADLLREKYNNDDDDGSMSDYRAALRINEHLPAAYVGMGEVALSHWNFEEIERLAQAALDVNPNYAPALHLLGKKSLLERRYSDAIELSDRALAINPNDLHALSIRAAAGACRYDESLLRTTCERVAAINPRCGLLHRMLGDALSGIRQYALSEREYLQAIEYDPTDANARTELGMMYMQWGLEKKAREVLEAAWALDPFNERTKFTIELLEMLEKFDRVETEHFVVKYDAQRDPGMGPFVAGYMEDIYGDVTGDYETPIDGKTIIEIFPTHRAFGVRITGKPWIHTVGAATGRVIALASPRDTGSINPYNLARVLKHEFTHTVTLEATQNRIPHWLTEGLAVYQEDAPRSFTWYELLADATRRGRLFTLESIDWGFIRPRRPNDRQMAYAQSEWMVQYIVDRFGYDVINEMLGLFHRGDTLSRVFQEELGVTVDAFDGEFEEWAKKQVAAWGFRVAPPENVDGLRLMAQERPDDAGILGRLARAEFDNGELEEAVKAARKALNVDENEPNALEVMARVLAMMSAEASDGATRQAHDAQAVPILERLLAADPDGWVAPKYLAEILLRQKNYDRAEPLLKRLQRLCPFDPTSWRGLAGVYLNRDDPKSALPQLQELARLDEHDAQVPAKIAILHRRDKRLREAQYWFRRALHVDPGNVGYQEAYAQTSMQVGDTQSALQAFELLTQMQPDNVEHFENAAFAAHKLGDRETAQRFANGAVELNPDSAAQSLLP